MTKSAFRSAVEDILDVPRGGLKDSDTRDTVETWTSLADIQILTLVASDLGVEADPELLQAETVGELLHALEERAVFAG
jgi:hypothetical protein